MKRPDILKRILAAGLTVLVAACTTALPAFAATPTPSGMIEMYVTSDNQYTDAAAALAQGFLKHDTKIDIRSYNVPVANIGALLTATLARYPELFFVERQFSYYSSGSNISYFVPTYTYSASQVNNMLKAFYAEADKYLAKAQGKLSKCGDDFSRAAVLHDELVLDAYYNLDNSSPYTFMIEKNGVCETYARVYAYLLAQCGIKSEIVDSDSMGHEWVMVKLDGSYYHVDITWDDPTPNKPGRAIHSYFLLSENKIKTSSDITKHTNFNTVNKATNTKYDSYAVHGFTTKLCKLDPDDKYVYAIGSNGIVKYNYSNNTSTTLLTISDKWYVSGNSGSFYTGIYSGLDNNNGLLYYNTPSKVYSFDPSTKKSTAVYTNTSSTQKLYGVRIRDNQLYGILSTGANTAGTEVFIKSLPEEAVTDPIVNNSTVSSTDITIGNSITFKGAATGGSGSYTYAVYLKSGSGWSKIGSTANFTYTPTATGTLTFKETVTDSDGDSADKEFTVTVRPKALTNVSTISSTNITYGDSVTVTAAGKDGSGSYTYAIYFKSGSTWIKISSSSTATYRPTAVGTTYMKTTVTDSEGTSADKEFTIIVTPQALVNESTINKTEFDADEDIIVTGAATGGVSAYTYNYYYRNYGDEEWQLLAEDQSSVTLTADPGKFEVKVTVTDSRGTTADKVFTVTVNAEPVVNNSTINKTEFIVGESITVTGAADGGTGSYTYTYYYRYAGVEEWTLIVSNKASITFTADAGELEIKVTAADTNGASDDKIFNATVSYEPVVNNSTIDKTELTLGESVEITGAAEGGSGNFTYTYYTRASEDSEWQELGTGESYTYTPAAGTVEFKVTAADDKGNSEDKTFTVTVNEPAAPLTNTSTINSNIVTINSKIWLYGSAEGGTGTYTYTYRYKRTTSRVWTVIGENVETNFACFTPSTAGVFDMAIIVTDSNGTTAENSFVVTVADGKSTAFRNESTISTTGAAPNTRIILTGAASGSSGYRYAFYYKRTNARNWTILGTEFGTDTLVAFTPRTEGEFNLKIDVLDENGEVVSRVFALSIIDGYKDTGIVNLSSINSPTIQSGSRLTVYGAAEGGTAPYTFAYYYKRAGATNWTLMADFSEETSRSVTLRTAGDYIVKVAVKDSAGGMISNNFDVTVTS